MANSSDVLHYFTSEVYGYFELVATLVWGILQAATSFGALLVDAFTLLLFGVMSLVANTAYAVIVILEDFGAFVADVVDVYIVTQNSLKSFIDGLSHVAFGTSSAFISGVKYLLETTIAVVFNLSGVLSLIASVLKSAIVLVGNSTMLLLQSILWGIVAVFACIKCVLMTLVWFIYSLPACFLYTFVRLILVVYDGLAEISLYTYTGLAIAAILAWFTRRAVQSSSWKQLLYALIGKFCQVMFRRARRGINDSLNSSIEHQDTEPETEPSGSRKEDSPHTVMRQLETERNEKLCVVCQDDPKCVILLPCRHLCLCRRCQSILLVTDPACPVCRRRIAETLHVYT